VSLRALTWLLAATAAATVAVEVLVFWYAPERGFGLAVRTGWAVLRSIGFLFLIWHVRAGRAGARPFGLILAVSTVFAVGRLLVPRSGLPAWPGLLGFAVLGVLCALVIWALYRSPAIEAHLVRRPVRRPVPPRVLTARVAVLSYAPLMLVPALASIGSIVDRRVPVTVAAWLVGAWLVVAFGLSYVLLLVVFFLLRGHDWARTAVIALTAFVVFVQLSLSTILLGVDGLIRDGGPLVVAAGLAVWGVSSSGSRRPLAADRG